MKIIHLFYPLQFPMRDFPGTKQVMAIGDFDGVHLGHQHVIGQAVKKAAELQLPASIMTFFPHPREVLGHSSYTRYLAPVHDKMQLFAQCGVDYTYIVSFDQAFARVSPEHFVLRMLDRLQLHTVVVGFDFTFGHKGQGTVETLRSLCRDRIEVEVAEPFHMDGDKVSSTLIRELLGLGQLDRVSRYLGRHYSVHGWVVTGEGRGRTIGFPTANLELTAPYVVPRNGVYAVKVTLDGEQYNGVMNIGVKPTFTPDEVHPSLEVHLLDYTGDLYGKALKLEFVSFLREEQRFSSVEGLVEQIHKDIVRARHLLSSE